MPARKTLKLSKNKKLSSRRLQHGWPEKLASDSSEEKEPMPSVCKSQKKNDKHVRRKGKIRPSELKRLANGEIEIDYKLNLHNHTREEARFELGEFLSFCVASSFRWVLVISGKGHNSENGISVLKSELPFWLDNDHSSSVSDHCFAHEKDGGEGARYIKLLIRDPD